MIMNIVNEYCDYYRRVSHTPSKTALDALFYATWCGRYICKKNFHVLRSEMPGFLMLYTINGSGTSRYKSFEYKLGPGSLFLIDCTTLHEYFPTSVVGWEFAYLHFNGIFADKMYSLITRNDRFIINLSKELSIPQRLENIMLHCEKEMPNSEICVSDIISHILHLLMAPDSGSAFHKSVREDMEKACLYIKENYKTSISVNDIAKYVNMSRGYFSKVFKQQTGKSPYEYILSCRIDHAKRLLCETHISISQIGFECGFEDSSSFIRCFKRECGTTPFSYRNNFFI